LRISCHIGRTSTWKVEVFFSSSEVRAKKGSGKEINIIIMKFRDFSNSAYRRKLLLAITTKNTKFLHRYFIDVFC